MCIRDSFYGFRLRFIATGKHIGKVVIKVRDEELAKVTKPVQKLVNAIPRTYMNPDKSYILIGTSLFHPHDLNLKEFFALY